MRVDPPSNTRSETVPLAAVRPGRVIELLSPAGKPNYYIVPKITALEANIRPVEGKVMLMNLETGRILMKDAKLPVAVLSATATTYYRT